jgi:CRISPR/Cas system-associated exonuclease Cas4 (RecB family)
MTTDINPQFFYNLFSNIHYEQERPVYDNDECSVTQAVQCLLKSFYERKFNRKLLEPKVVILSFGRIIHLALQEQLQTLGYQTEAEAYVEIPQGKMWAHCDALGQNHMLEIKTISRIPNEILSHHYLQSISYTSIFKIPHGYVGYIHKPSGIIKVFPHEQDPRQYAYVLMRSARLITCLKRNTTPEPEPSWLCQYCEYPDLCPSQQKLRRGKGGM